MKKVYVERATINYKGWIRSGAKTGLVDPWDRDYLNKKGIGTFKPSGITFRSDVLLKKCFSNGSAVKLVPDFDNEHDENAIGVWDKDRKNQLGWVPKDLAAELKLKKIHDGYIISTWEDKKTKERKGFEIAWADFPFKLVVLKKDE